MYPNYPYDHTKQAEDNAARSVEGDQYHSLIQSGSVTVVCTANVASSQAFVFPRQFTPSTIPDLLYSLKTVGDITSTIKFTDITAITEFGFTLRVLTDITQSLIYTWLAKGVAG